VNARVSSKKIAAIEIAACEPLAGRLPTQAKARVRTGGRSAATPASDDFNRQIFIRTLAADSKSAAQQGGNTLKRVVRAINPIHQISAFLSPRIPFGGDC
jgi:hypothetical protein